MCCIAPLMWTRASRACPGPLYRTRSSVCFCFVFTFLMCAIDEWICAAAYANLQTCALRFAWSTHISSIDTRLSRNMIYFRCHKRTACSRRKKASHQKTICRANRVGKNRRDELKKNELCRNAANIECSIIIRNNDASLARYVLESQISSPHLLTHDWKLHQKKRRCGAYFPHGKAFITGAPWWDMVNHSYCFCSISARIFLLEGNRESKANSTHFDANLAHFWMRTANVECGQRNTIWMNPPNDRFSPFCFFIF